MNSFNMQQMHIKVYYRQAQGMLGDTVVLLPSQTSGGDRKGGRELQDQVVGKGCNGLYIIQGSPEERL